MVEPTDRAKNPLRSQSEMVRSNSASLTNIPDQTTVAQLDALQANFDTYWDIENPCEAATIEYLATRPYDIDCFADAPDHVKAAVLIRVPEQVHAWFRKNAIRSPVDPQGFREAIVREMLLKFKNSEAFNLLRKTIVLMKAVGYQWTELDVIGKAAEQELLLRQKSVDRIPE